MAKALVDLSAGSWTDGQGVTLGAWLEQWLQPPDGRRGHNISLARASQAAANPANLRCHH
jgi:hypothetical protein